jgi:hypothetical protein
MTKLIAAVIVLLLLWGGWNLFLYWEKVKNEEETARKQVAATTITDPRQLPGLPQNLEPTLDAAQKQGAAGMRKWLRTYGHVVQDPRKAWVELDYCVAVSRADPAEAKRIFALVKARTPPASPVWPRLKQLEKSYE